MATIYDVSKNANVSVATVSRVLNNNPKVDVVLKQRVLESIRELGFVPNGIARSLKTKRTERIALVIPDITNPFFPEMARGVQDTLETHGYHVILANTDDDPTREIRYLEMLTKVGVDGLVITPSLPKITRQAPDFRKLEQALKTLSVPTVGISVTAVSQNADHVRTDEESSGEKATEHLLGLGHTAVALIHGPDHSEVSQCRTRGFIKALKNHGLEPEPFFLRDGHARREGGRTAMQELLALPQRPSAVFAINDIMALGAMGAIHDAGLTIPDDIAIVSIDNIAEAVTAYPPLSTMAMPSNYEQGRIAAQLLLERIAQGDPNWPQRVITLEMRLIVRGSTVKGLGLVPLP